MWANTLFREAKLGEQLLECLVVCKGIGKLVFAALLFQGNCQPRHKITILSPALLYAPSYALLYALFHALF